MNSKRTVAAGLAAACLGVGAAVMLAAPAGAYIPQISESPDADTVLAAISVEVDSGGTYAIYNGGVVEVTDAIEWTLTVPSYSGGPPCSAPTITADLDLYPPTLTVSIADPTPCTWDAFYVRIRVRGAEFTAISYNGSADNVFVVPMEPMSARHSLVGSRSATSTGLRSALSAPYPVFGGSIVEYDATTDSYTGRAQWTGTSGASLNGTVVLGLTMAGVPARPAGGLPRFTG